MCKSKLMANLSSGYYCWNESNSSSVDKTCTDYSGRL